jgi:nucleoside-diphosphate-sugar epimerase
MGMVGLMAKVAVVGPVRPLLPAVVRRLRAEPGLEPVVTDTVDGADAVVHLAGVMSEDWLRDPEGAAVETVRRTRELLDGAGATPVASLVHVSSASVYGAWPDNPVPIPEDAPLRPNLSFAYARAHAESERLVAEWRDEHPGVHVAVLRPTIVMGGEGPSWMARAVGAMQAPRPVEARRPLQFVHADDVASAVTLVLEDNLEGAFNVAPDGWVPDETARALAGGLARVPLPGWLARPLGRVGWRFTRRGTPAQALPWTMHPWVVANDRLRAAGWEPTYTNEEAFVAASPPPPLSGVIARHRQELTLGAAGVLVAGAAGGVAAVIRLRRRRASAS